MTRMIRSLALASTLGLAVATTAFQAAARAETIRVSFVQTNDIDRMEEADGRGGFARLAAVVKAERAKGNVFFVHAGDTISPSLLSGFDSGAHVIDILNRMGIDVMVPGNHEFDFGPDVFRQRMSEATFPIVASNVSMPGGGGPPNTTGDRIVAVDGVRFGFYGLTTEETATSSSPGEIAFIDSVETGINAAEDLRAQGADIVVAVVHTPLDVDFALVRASAADIVLSGHDEHLLAYYDGRTVLTESGAQANRVLVTDLTITREEEDGAVTVSWYPDFRVIDTLTVEPDAEIAALVKTYTDKLDEELGVVIGRTETQLDSRRAVVRGGEAAIGNLITDAMREAVDADIAMINGGAIRAEREYAPGTEIMRKDILAELPFGNRTVKIELTGELLVDVLENSVTGYSGMGGRSLQVSGMRMRIDPDRPEGERVLGVEVGGAPLDPAAKYTVATNDFMAAGGNEYAPFKRGTTLIAARDARLLASDVIDYIAARGTVAPVIEGRIVIE